MTAAEGHEYFVLNMKPSIITLLFRCNSISRFGMNIYLYYIWNIKASRERAGAEGLEY